MVSFCFLSPLSQRSIVKAVEGGGVVHEFFCSEKAAYLSIVVDRSVSIVKKSSCSVSMRFLTHLSKEAIPCKFRLIQTIGAYVARFLLYDLSKLNFVDLKRHSSRIRNFARVLLTISDLSDQTFVLVVALTTVVKSTKVWKKILTRQYSANLSTLAAYISCKESLGTIDGISMKETGNL